ncbi:unnamed protein product [[Actinomadura] parvosata subsp. kistnae]|nr:unnamed protein product [Actinomadura parvosata subsp. kistnae]
MLLWDLRPEQSAHRICTLTGTFFTHQTWQRDVGKDVAYAPPCA